MDGHGEPVIAGVDAAGDRSLDLSATVVELRQGLLGSVDELGQGALVVGVGAFEP